MSILRIADKKIVVKAINGDVHLGGQDVDNELVKFFIQKIKEEH